MTDKLFTKEYEAALEAAVAITADRCSNTTGVERMNWAGRHEALCELLSEARESSEESHE